MRDDLRRASRSVAANIAEGFWRYHQVDFARFFGIALESLGESEDHLETATVDGLLDAAGQEELKRLALRTRVATQRLRAYLLKSKRAPAHSASRTGRAKNQPNRVNLNQRDEPDAPDAPEEPGAPDELNGPAQLQSVMKIVLAGASGFLGRPLSRSLAAEGHDLVLLTRRPTGASKGVREVAWQPDGTAGPWADVVDGAGAVVNLAGESIAEGRWTSARKAALTESRLLSTRSLVAAIERARSRPSVMISGSAVGYYGPRGDELVTEADGPGDDFLGRLSAEWEHAALAAEAGGSRVVLVRTGLVLERDGGALEAMLAPFRAGVGGPLGRGNQYWPWIHRADWIALVRWLLADPSSHGPVNATAPTPVTNEEFSRDLARVLKRPCFFRAPAFALRLAMGEMADALLLKGQRVVPSRALAMGFRFEYESLEPALRAILL